MSTTYTATQNSSKTQATKLLNLDKLPHYTVIFKKQKARPLQSMTTIYKDVINKLHYMHAYSKQYIKSISHLPMRITDLQISFVTYLNSCSSLHACNLPAFCSRLRLCIEGTCVYLVRIVRINMTAVIHRTLTDEMSAVW